MIACYTNVLALDVQHHRPVSLLEERESSWSPSIPRRDPSWSSTSARSTSSSSPAGSASSTSSRRSSATTSRPSAVRELNPLALILSGGPGASTSPAPRSAIRQLFRWASRCWASATACNWPARPWAARCRPARPREYGRAECRVLDRQRAPVPRRARRDRRLDEPRRPGPGRRRGLRPAGRHRHLPDRRRQASQSLPVYGLQFHPEVTHTPLRLADPGQLPRPDLRLPAALDDGDVHRARRSSRSASSVGPNDRVDLRPVRRRRFVGRAPPCWRRPSGRRSSASSSTTACSAQASGERWPTTFGRPLQGRPARRRCRRPVPRRPGRRDRPAGEAASASATRSSTSSATRPGRSPTPSSWPRARSTPT